MIKRTDVRLSMPDPKLSFFTFLQKKTAQRESFWAGYPADVPRSFVQTSGSKPSGRPSKPWKSKHLGADIHDPNARTSMTPGGAKNFGQQNFGSIFVFFLFFWPHLYPLKPRKWNKVGMQSVLLWWHVTVGLATASLWYKRRKEHFDNL